MTEDEVNLHKLMLINQLVMMEALRRILNAPGVYAGLTQNDLRAQIEATKKVLS